MSASNLSAPTANLRLWPGVLFVVLMWFLMIVPALVMPRTLVHFISLIAGPVLMTLAIVIWWLFASRIPKPQRWTAFAFFAIAAVCVTTLFYLANPMAVLLYGFALVTTLWVVGLLLSSGLDWPSRFKIVLALIVLGWGLFGLLRIDGINADFIPQVRWRWQPTAEEDFLAEKSKHIAPESLKLTTAILKPGDWAEFRGPKRDAKLTGVKIATDWDQRPPKQLWKHKIGPGWGAFAVVNDRLYTQEQHGQDEAVVCYHADTGNQIWQHLDHVRFFEGISGAGPRATPTFLEGRLYSLGATGILNCLDANSGKVIWTRDITKDSGAKVPDWGFSSSPLVAEGKVIVFSGAPGKATLAYNSEKGDLAWAAGEGTHGYCSPQFEVIDGISQVIIASNFGLESFRPSDGQRLWAHDWNLPNMNRVTQAQRVDDNDFLIFTGVGNDRGTRRVRINHANNAWTTAAQWTSKGLKPYFNDGVLHNDHFYGFDDSIFTCINMKNGERTWKGGRFGHGQVLLLADQNLLLISAENGNIVLVEANPKELKQVAKFKAIEGKTWNHPVLAHGRLYLRNGEEMACYQLNLAE